ncbi:MAG: hypothetical protein A2167_08680 [Planctomycetes bacterium RBG_13_46_10]|nr:MAG: hypothetical protein A2167_08680 [Planctomycetes bacterium RBG_13_46_10]
MIENFLKSPEKITIPESPRKYKDEDIKILESADIEEKIAAQSVITARVATRRFLEESCELAKLLPPRKKCLFIMHYSAGLSQSDIAKLCNVSEGTVYRRLKQITKELNEMRKCCDRRQNGTKTYKNAKERLVRTFQRKNRVGNPGIDKNIPGPLP